MRSIPTIPILACFAELASLAIFLLFVWVSGLVINDQPRAQPHAAQIARR